jgi:hypothetical protein
LGEFNSKIARSVFESIGKVIKPALRFANSIVEAAEIFLIDDL